ncbi:MAG: SIR2 family protein, partial [Pseudomonadota bacterium]
MIAFVGSGATRNHGYSGWDKTFVDNYRKAIAATVEDELATASEKKTFTEKNNIARAIIKGLKANKGEAPLKSDVALNLDLLENLYGITRLPEDAEEFQKVRKKFAELFNPQSFKHEESKPEKVPLEKDVLQSLFSQLLIRRIITLNYDVEAEIAFLRQVRKCSRNTAIKDLVREFETLPDDTIDLTLDLPNGYRLRSLIAERNKNDKLVEFALGAPDRTISILHLHGRYDQPNSLVVSKRDYRDLYWRKDLSKPLVEQGLKSVFIGNPILHIGIGMSEADVTRTLEQFMSDTPLDVEFPRFILKNTFATEPENEAFRLRMFHDFGVYTIFDTDV